MKNAVRKIRMRPRQGRFSSAVAAPATPNPPADRPASSWSARCAAHAQSLPASGQSSNAGTTTPTVCVTTRAVAARREPTRRSYRPSPTPSSAPTKR